MGAGLAVQFARHGHPVTLVDHRQSNLDDAIERIVDAAELLSKESCAETTAEALLERIEFTLDREAGVSSAELVVESVSEDLAVKRELFRSIGEAAPDTAILASNTSGLRITDIAAGAERYAERIVGCHWWNPPYIMPLVELVPGEETSDATVDELESLVKSVDRTPIRLQRDAAGFVWNRIQFAVLRECIHIVDEGIASVEAVDAAVRDGYALRTATVGPFETVDISGVDLFETIGEELYPELSARQTPSERFDELLTAGREGVDAGAGFYDYDESLETVVHRRDRKIARLRNALGATDEQ
ncbi:3-hydroxyacyl-CoA dehydrogenase NAD-binding protein [Halococcus salifodinae DSM 8989]|uniref:3-hydroxyacyl-CoA dehydrogenase NAD-binding protein n=2 Tax=Halococcus salifodinae TaxID=36738 RepID=M0N9X4_9EURY|nr:3-hydroxyacyl-CoA dehydrogenase NAD-binding protein [Halococcus salifodinae DSM 8989]